MKCLHTDMSHEHLGDVATVGVNRRDADQKQCDEKLRLPALHSITIR